MRGCETGHFAWARWVALAGLLLWGCSPGPTGGGPQEKADGDSVTVEVNSKAPAFATKTLDGGEVRLAEYVGRNVVVLEFWSIFCKSCIEEMPHIEALYAKYRDEGLVVLSINTDVFSSKKVASFLERAGIHPPYPVVRDQRQEVVAAYNVEVLPVTVIIDRDGWIRLYQEGYRPGDERRFERTVRSLLGREAAEDVTLAARGGVTSFAAAGASLAAVGQRFEGLRGVTPDGTSVPVSGEGPRLLYFWSLYCSPCRAEFPTVAALADRYRDRGLATTGVNVDSVRLSVRVARFAAKHPALGCVLDDPASGQPGIARPLGVRATPTIVLLDGAGQVRYVSSGAYDHQELEREIEGLLAF